MGGIASFSGKYWFLSNFYAVWVEYEGDIYPSTEAAYQAAKSMDMLERKAIREAPTPSEAKRLGGKYGIIRHLRPDWEEVKLDVMYSLLQKKFHTYPFNEMLLATGDSRLEEGGVGDRFWGTVDSKGENYLGRLLMIIREELRGEA